MKIAYVSSSEFGCPAPGNQIQAALWVASQVIEGMTRKNHETVYIGVDGSTVKASKVISMGPAFFDLFSYDQWVQLPTAHKDQTLNNYQTKLQLFLIDILKSEKCDLVHYHTSPPIFMLPFSRSIEIPKLQTLHDPLYPSYEPIFRQYQEISNNYYASISNAQRAGAPYLNYVETVYNGIEPNIFDYSPVGGDELLFLGRFKKIKGIDQAIQTALQANIPLTIAGREAKTEIDFLHQAVEPYIDGQKVKKLGIINHQEISQIISHSKALLFPIRWEEPFGLVMIEAMACGTPVIAYNHGSVPEIVRDGVTGFIVEDDDNGQIQTNAPIDTNEGKWIIKKRGIEGLVEAVQRIGEIDRAACRRHVEENFTVEKMVEGYERVYQKVIASK